MQLIIPVAPQIRQLGQWIGHVLPGAAAHGAQGRHSVAQASASVTTYMAKKVAMRSLSFLIRSGLMRCTR
jgi:hypothetical protein